MRVLHMDAAVSTDGPQTLASTFKDETFWPVAVLSCVFEFRGGYGNGGMVV
jgi:hypothetical protein